MSAAAQGKAVCFQSQRHNGEVPYLSRSQCSKEQWGLKKSAFPNFTMVVDLCSVNLAKLEVKQKPDAFDTQVRAAYQVLPVTAHAHHHLPAARLIGMGKQPGPWQLHILPDLSLWNLPLVGQVCFSFTTTGTSFSCRTPIAKVTDLAGERPAWILVHPHGLEIICVSSSLFCFPHFMTIYPDSLLALGSRTSFQGNSLS